MVVFLAFMSGSVLLDSNDVLLGHRAKEKGFLAERHVAEEFLIRLEQSKNHRGHLPGDPSDRFQLATMSFVRSS